MQQIMPLRHMSSDTFAFCNMILSDTGTQKVVSQKRMSWAAGHAAVSQAFITEKPTVFCSPTSGSQQHCPCDNLHALSVQILRTLSKPHRTRMDIQLALCKTQHLHWLISQYMAVAVVMVPPSLLSQPHHCNVPIWPVCCISVW